MAEVLFLDTYINTGYGRTLTLYHIVLNDRSLTETGIKPYYLVEGQESKSAKAYLDVIALNWAVDEGILKNAFSERATNRQKVAKAGDLVNQFLAFWGQGEEIDVHIGEGIRRGSTQLSDTLVVITLFKNDKEQDMKLSDATFVPWIYASSNIVGTIFVEIEVNKRTSSIFGGFFGGSIRGLVDMLVFQSPQDMSVVVVLRMCGQDTISTKIIDGLSEISRDLNPAFQTLPLGTSGTVDNLGACVIANR